MGVEVGVGLRVNLTLRRWRMPEGEGRLELGGE